MNGKNNQLVLLALLALLQAVLLLSCELALVPQEAEQNATRHEITIVPQDDGWINNSDYYDTYDYLPVWQQGDTCISLLRFNLEEIPTDARIISACLFLRTKSMDTAYDHNLYCHPIVQDWDPTIITLTMVNSTLFYDSFTVLFNGWITGETVNKGRLFSWDISSMVQRWISGYPNNGILIKSEYTYTAIDFYSSRSSYPPQIVIEYEVDAD